MTINGDQKPGEAERERFGGLTERIPATFIDLVLLNLSFLGVLSVSGGGTAFSFVVATIFVFGGLTIMTGVSGLTPGKFFYKTRITSDDASTTPPSWSSAIRRTLVSLLGLIPIIGIVFHALNIIFVYADDERRSLLDRAGQTRIVKTSELVG